MNEERIADWLLLRLGARQAWLQPRRSDVAVQRQGTPAADSGALHSQPPSQRWLPSQARTGITVVSTSVTVALGRRPE